jgi:hypothetical protein
MVSWQALGRYTSVWTSLRRWQWIRTKTDADRALYDKEFQELCDTAVRADLEEFNGLRLFRGGGKLYELVNKGSR